MNQHDHEHTSEEHAADSRAVFGFWIYLMSDCVLFASLFAVYAVLHGNTFGGPTSSNLFNLPFVLKETLLLLTSSFTCGLGILAARGSTMRATLFWFGITFLLGLLFVVLETSEFLKLIADGSGPTMSGFLSSYFVLVGTHGLHVSLGLIWIFALLVRIYQRGLTRFHLRKLILLSLFWHFLDIIWIFIFSFVYLLGVL